MGAILVGLASLQFGTVVVFASFLAGRDVPVSPTLTIRFGVAALLLAAVLLSTRGPLLPAEGERLGLVAIAAVGYAVEANLFFAALGYGTAAAVTLLFYTYPVFVAIGSWLVLRRGAPAGRTLLALALAIVGVTIVVGAGGSFAIEPLGVALSLASALVITLYMLGADVILDRTLPLTASMWVSVVVCVAMAARALVLGEWVTPSGWSGWGPLLGMGAATAGAFVCLLAGIRRLGAERTSIVSSTEPLAAALLAYAFLGQAVGVGVALGGALILAGAIVASLARTPTPQEQQIP